MLDLGIFNGMQPLQCELGVRSLLMIRYQNRFKFWSFENDDILALVLHAFAVRISGCQILPTSHAPTTLHIAGDGGSDLHNRAMAPLTLLPYFYEDSTAWHIDLASPCRQHRGYSPTSLIARTSLLFRAAHSTQQPVATIVFPPCCRIAGKSTAAAFPSRLRPCP
jgi:hypothetical protein